MIIQIRAVSLFFPLLLIGCAGNAIPTRDLSASGPVDSRPTAAGDPQQAAPTAPVSPSAGMRVYKDPVTGEFTEPPVEVTPPAAPEAMRGSVSTTRTPEMQEVKVPGPAGGTKIHLQGRFRSYSTATKDADGKVRIHCDQKVPGETTDRGSAGHSGVADQ